MKKIKEKKVFSDEYYITITSFKNDVEGILFKNDRRFLNDKTYRVIELFNEVIIYLVCSTKHFNDQTKDIIEKELKTFKGEI